MAGSFAERMYAAEAAAARETIQQRLGAEDLVARRQENLLRRYGPTIKEDTGALSDDIDLWSNPNRAEELRTRQARRMSHVKELGWESFEVPDPRPTKFAQAIYRAQVEAGKTKLPRSRRRAYLQMLATPILQQFGPDFISEQMLQINHAMALGGEEGVPEAPPMAAGEKGAGEAPGGGAVAPSAAAPMLRPDAAGYIYELLSAAAPDEMTEEDAREAYVKLDLYDPKQPYDENVANWGFDLAVSAGWANDTPQERADFLAKARASKETPQVASEWQSFLGNLPEEFRAKADGTPKQHWQDFSDPFNQRVAKYIELYNLTPAKAVDQAQQDLQQEGVTERGEESVRLREENIALREREVALRESKAGGGGGGGPSPSPEPEPKKYPGGTTAQSRDMKTVSDYFTLRQYAPEEYEAWANNDKGKARRQAQAALKPAQVAWDRLKGHGIDPGFPRPGSSKPKPKKKAEKPKSSATPSAIAKKYKGL